MTVDPIEMSSEKVWIAIQGIEAGYTVFEARPYQADAYSRFMSQGKPPRMEFHFPASQYNTDGDVVFFMEPFDSTGFRGTYESFCVLVNENGEKHLLSNEEEVLRRFTGYMNRVWFATC